MKWIIYYDDGSSFTSDDGPPEKAPKDGVQLVAYADISVGVIRRHGADFYCWHKEGLWIPHTKEAKDYYVSLSKQGLEPGIVINGYEIFKDNWARIYNFAVDEDKRLPTKMAWDPRETPFEAV